MVAIKNVLSRRERRATINVRVFEQVLRRLNWIYAGADDHKSLGQGSVIIRWTTLSKAWLQQP